ncbi:MAG: hypothetical protein R8G34_17940 [Paracoccaceae bacterium]|nr:hypothetical protein [Paracoccaceae bacterium]
MGKSPLKSVFLKEKTARKTLVANIFGGLSIKSILLQTPYWQGFFCGGTGRKKGQEVMTRISPERAARDKPQKNNPW